MDRADIQGIVLHGYRRAPFARYHLLRFGAGAARRWLTRTILDITNADEPRALVRQNVAFAARGLRALGLSEPEMAQFSREFRQGMAHPERSRVLGDRNAASPEQWEFGGPGDALDAVLMTYGENEHSLRERSACSEARLDRFGIVWTAQDALLEHSNTVKSRKKEKIALGEFVLGYRDSVGERQLGPFVALKWSTRPLPAWSKPRNALDFGTNGSYLVVRKLARVGALSALQRAELERAHARRALGPVGARSHRLLRRSRHYGGVSLADEPEARGLWFMAFNADIRRQFEYVRENYLNGAPEAGMASHASLSQLMRVRGGQYFFAPGLRALNYLAQGAG